MLEENLIWNYFFQIADAVRYMHKLRIMHRDIKPANVLVGANGALKLGDLGLGRHFSEHTNEAFSKVRPLPRAACLGGQSGCAAPGG